MSIHYKARAGRLSAITLTFSVRPKPEVMSLCLSVDGMFSGGAGRVGKWGLPVDHHSALRLPG